MSKKEIFNLYLASYNSSICLNASTLYNCLYMINFDALFNGKNLLYRNCAVRCSLLTNNNTQVAIGSATGNLVLRGLPVKNTLGIDVIYLCQLNPSSTVNVGGGSNAGFYYGISTLDQIHGTPMGVPIGTQQFRVQFLNEAASGFITALEGEYHLLLQFELSDPIENLGPN